MREQTHTFGHLFSPEILLKTCNLFSRLAREKQKTLDSVAMESIEKENGICAVCTRNSI